MNGCKMSIIDVFQYFHSNQKGKQKKRVWWRRCHMKILTRNKEIVVLFSKSQHFCKASDKPLIRPLSLKLSCDQANRSLLSDTPHKYSFI